MLRALAWLPLLGLALAGCSQAPETDAVGAEVLAPLAADIAAGNATGNHSAVPATDRLHVVASTHLNTTGLANVTVVATLAGALAQTLSWNTTLAGAGNVSLARLNLWVDLGASALHPGVGGDPACSASVTYIFTVNGTNLAQAGGCGSIGQGTVPPGEYLLDIGSPLTAFPAGLVLTPGDKVLVQVAFGFVFPQGQGFVLSGGDRSSALHLPGLAEPV